MTEGVKEIINRSVIKHALVESCTIPDNETPEIGVVLDFAATNDDAAKYFLNEECKKWLKTIYTKACIDEYIEYMEV